MNLLHLEIAANVMTAVCIFLAGRNNIHTWWTGIVACVFFGLLFFQVQLYADVTLQAFFIATSIIGWQNWNSSVSKISSISGKSLALSLVLANTVAIIYGTLLYLYTDAYAPWVDSIVLTLSILGQILLMKRYIQTWPVWVAVNLLSVPLYYSRGLYITAAMYFAFLLNALYSWYSWKRSA